MNQQNETVKEIGKAVAIAALSALATGIVNWLVEELKAKTKKKS